VNDRVTGVLHGMRLPDSDEATIDLHFNWFKDGAGGALEPLASSVMRTSWVKVLGHGIVAKHPLPAFLVEFLRDIGERREKSVVLPKLGLSALLPGKCLASFTRQFGHEPLLHSEEFQTDQEDSNLVGNIYHSHYGKWQARVRDRYLRRHDAEHFMQGAATGEWVCQSSRITYLRDAMPFDTLEIEMSLRELSECGASLGFTYFRKDTDSRRTKLARGEQELVWAVADADGRLAAAAIPEMWLAALRVAAQAAAPLVLEQ
jgi:acyl-CoA thioesterase FadM